MVDQGCPTLKRGQTCSLVPHPATIELVAASGGTTVVARGRAGAADGRFRIAVPAGRYVVTARNLDGLPVPSAKPVDVTVPDGEYVSVTIQFDSGVR